MAIYIVCEGSVRGACGHKHRTVAGALRCLHSDQRGCKRQGGYSDRSMVVYGRAEPWGRVIIPSWVAMELTLEEALREALR